MINFNQPYITGKEFSYIKDALKSGHISGNGKYTKICQQFFEERWNIPKVLLTTSCTDALEMCSMLLNIKAGDEVIIPSFTFVSTALAFARQGAKIIFAESKPDHPNMDENEIEELITPKTRAIVPVHYAGVACNMDRIVEIAKKHNLFVVEDAAQSIESFYLSKSGLRKQLGTLGHLAAFSFHETKNIQCGEGGLLAVNDEQFIKRAEIIWEKGTNRTQFFRGETDKYGWMDIGSSFLPSDISAAFLWAQLEKIEKIQRKRKRIWDFYYQHLKPFSDQGYFTLPVFPDYATNNAHMFFICCNSSDEQSKLISYLRDKGIMVVFHYRTLHNSPYYHDKHDGRKLPNSEHFADCLVRLPLFYDLRNEDQNYVISSFKKFYGLI